MLEEFHRRHFEAPAVAEKCSSLKGAIVRDWKRVNFNPKTGKPFSKQTFYNHNKKFLDCNGVITKYTPCSRMDIERKKTIRNFYFTVGIIKNQFRGVASEKAVNILKNQLSAKPDDFNLALSKFGFDFKENQYIQEILDFHPATHRRYLKQFGWNTKGLSQIRTAQDFKNSLNYVQQCVMLDASPTNQFHMTFKGEVVHTPDLDPKDPKYDDILYKRSLTKVQGYCWKEVKFGGYQYFYCGDVGVRNKGENADDWIKAIKYFMSEKEMLPFRGTWDLTYCDRGSGLLSAKFQSFMLSLNPLHIMKTHFPKSPWSKGNVEGQISGHKRGIEKFLQREFFDSIDHLNRETEKLVALQQWKMDKRCQIYVNNVALRPSPLAVPNEQNFKDALEVCYECSVDVYKSIRIKNIGRFRLVFNKGEDCQSGIWVRAYRRGASFVVLLPDRRLVDVVPFDERDPSLDWEKDDRQNGVELIKKSKLSLDKDSVLGGNFCPDEFHLENTVGVDTHLGMVCEDLYLDVKAAFEYIRYRLWSCGLEDKDCLNDIFVILQNAKEQGIDLDKDLILGLVNAHLGENV